jgi:hypothetical protein
MGHTRPKNTAVRNKLGQVALYPTVAEGGP